MKINLKQILDNQEKTQYWLSKTTRISSNNIGDICNGKTKSIRFDTIEKICQALNCTPNDIFICDTNK